MNGCPLGRLARLPPQPGAGGHRWASGSGNRVAAKPLEAVRRPWPDMVQNSLGSIPELIAFLLQSPFVNIAAGWWY